jgi:hypothetical protein
MGWDRSRYYTRSRKVDGRVVREYVGVGPIGELAAAEDAMRRAERTEAAAAWQAEKARFAALDAKLAALESLTQIVAEAAILAAGYHKHNREWRQRRGSRSG